MGLIVRYSTACILALIAFDASATVILDPECTAKAEVLDIYSRKYTKPTYEIFYAPFKIIETDCAFLKKDAIYDTTGSNSGKEDLQKGMVITSGVVRNSAMGPNGRIDFLDWQPIEIIAPQSQKMPDGYLRTSERSPR